MPNLNSNEINLLIVDVLSGEATPEEQNQLLLMIESNEAYREYYIRLRDLWMQAALGGVLDSDKVERALQQADRKINRLSVADRRVKLKEMQRRGWRFSILKYAVAVVITGMITYGLTNYYGQKRQESHGSEMVYEAHYGSRAFAILPDSSKVWINSGSKLSFKAGYNHHQRVVELTGEAYFDVKTNPQKPFVVKAGGLDIKATGTEFNVKAYPDEDLVTTTLVKGVVVVEGVDRQQKAFALKMKPSQSLSCYSNGNKVISGHSESQTEEDVPAVMTPVILRNTRTESLVSWKSDQWEIDNIEFGELAILLERRYNVTICFNEGAERLKKYHYTGRIGRETIEQMLQVFRYSIPFRYSINKDVITIMTDEQLQKQYDIALKKNN